MSGHAETPTLLRHEFARYSQRRPRWAERLRWLTDPNFDLPDWAWDYIWPLYERPVLRGLCLLFGHGDNFEGRCVYCSTPNKGFGDDRAPIGLIRGRPIPRRYMATSGSGEVGTDG